jgi:UDP-N-acetylmuramate dehydrogenase
LENQLKNIVKKGLVAVDEPMSAHTTFRIGGPADYYVEPTFEEVKELLPFLKKENIPYTLIGNGSNLLVSDEGIEGVVVSFGKEMSEVSCEKEVVRARAGILLSRLASFAASKSLSGLEFASGIPGTLGGAITMNAGAYGGEMKDVVQSVTVLDGDEIKEYSGEEMDFSYRHSRYTGTDDIVLSAKIKLTQGDSDEIRAKMDELSARRRQSQPLNMPSAGSFFKRPVGNFAGTLIDKSGLKGYSVGGAQVSEKHAGFIVNTGGATFNDVLRLMEHVQKTVFDLHGVSLEPEVRIVR